MSEPSSPASERTGLRVTFDGGVYPAEEIARGAAYELLSADEVTGWAPGAKVTDDQVLDAR
ncbi:hypothetical protein ACFY1S_01380 [Micromonospora sp. NPDC000663]|uniref:hypothetical protein n=1 Tax=Micromonospora sp. NPDC000663 TaxID=3364218 RepID=UPI0036BF3846